jgi:hypothetical protein
MRQGPGGGNVVSGGTVGGPVIQAQSIGQVVVQQGVLAPATADEDEWVRRVRASSVWDHVSPHRDVSSHRESTASVAARLAFLRDEAEQRLGEDPWQEPQFATRFAERVEWLLGEPDDGNRLDLYPAEASLLVLTPLLYRVHALRSAARRLDDVRPWTLEPLGTPHGSDRSAFEAFAEDHGLLVQRALLRRESEATIGWWLYHRWLVRYDAYEKSTGEAPVADLLKALGETAAALGEALDAGRVSRLLHGLRRGPDVCNPEYLDGLPADDRLRGPGHQRVRDQRLVLLAALAYTVSVEMTALPDVVAEHLGIPHAVDLGELRSSLEGSSWGGSAQLPVLRADCGHEAVIEGLRAYVTRADELLHAVSRTVRDRVNQPMPALPSRLSSDGVCPSGGAFMGWASFRLDERRIRDLLMGVQLYKDRDLAVRELYQNALDACRYRRARTEYLDRTHPAASYTYEGRIRFEQDIDDHGREYVECRDNGIGMGEAELRGVFSNAGARFAEQPDFREEQALWARLDPPVRLHPNSRFGIGVLSYFMLADEIRVTTCRMRPDGTPGPVLEVSIFGPGHLFRIVPIADEGAEPGTTVRLYLRDGEEESESTTPQWSCTQVLRRLLAIAEFPTEARHEEVVVWPAGQLVTRKQPEGELFGLAADGDLVVWPDAPEGAQVIWCRRGGGLLVDGLVVQPAVRGDVLSSKASGLTGVVVNLSGEFSPKRLSADRSQVLDDLRAPVRALLRQAVGHLVSSNSELADFSWLCTVADGSLPLADIVAAAYIEAGLVLEILTEEFDAGRGGCLPTDRRLLFRDGRYGMMDNKLLYETFAVPDHIYLWRLLAIRPAVPLLELTELCPELGAVGPVLPAVPSDHALLRLQLRPHTGVGDVTTKLVDAAETLSRSPRDTALRAARLNLHHEVVPERLPETNTRPQDARRAAEARRTSRVPRRQGIRTAATVTVQSLIREAVEKDTTVESLVAESRRSGVEISAAMRATAMAAAEDDALLIYLSGDDQDWFTPAATVHPAQSVDTAMALHLDVPDLCERLVRCGLRADPTGLPVEPTEDFLMLLSEDLDAEEPWLRQSEPVPPQHVLVASQKWKVGTAEAMERYARLGFVPPAPFPEVVEPGDVDVLTPFSDADGPAVPLRPGRVIPYSQVFGVAARSGMSLRRVVDRLRAFGIPVPLRPPRRMTALDKELFKDRGVLSWTGVTTDDHMPFAHIIGAAQQLLRQPKEIAARLAELGVEPSCPDLPEGLSFRAAQRLLTDDEDYLMNAEDHVSFQFLLRRAQSMGIEVGQAYTWLSQLGVSVDDPAEVIRAALPLIPRAAP